MASKIGASIIPYITFSFEITSSYCPWLKTVSCLSSLKALTVADIVTVAAIPAVFSLSGGKR